MARRRRGQQSMMQNQPYGLTNTQLEPSQNYSNAVEPIHNGNFAWNGQPIPTQVYQQAGQTCNSNLFPKLATMELRMPKVECQFQVLPVT